MLRSSTRCAELGDLLLARRADQVAHGVEGRHDALLEQQRECRPRLRSRTCWPPGAAAARSADRRVRWLCALQRVVGAAEGQAGEQIVAVAVVGERARLAHQRPDDVAVVDAMLAAARAAAACVSRCAVAR